MAKQSGLPAGAALSIYEERCRLTLETALQRTPLYESWRSLDPGPAADIDERCRALPVLTKDDLRAALPYGLVPRGLNLDDALARGEVSFVRTSGTSDEALRPGAGRRAAGEAEDALRLLFGNRTRISVSVVEQLFPEKSGKFLLANRSFALEASHG